MRGKSSPKPRAVASSRRFAVLMAGGAGTRFWPWSRVDLPKQLLPLAGEESMLAETVARLDGVIPTQNIIVVTSKRLQAAVRRALPMLPASAILAEPEGRNTAACVGWAAIEIRHRDKDAVMLVLPADHVVSPLARFRQAMRNALDLAESKRVLVTFGVKPTAPETGYGYIQVRRSSAGNNGSLAVAAFREKPDEARARRFVRAGNYYWNSGMFAWRADVILEEIAAHAPALSADLIEMDRAWKGGKVPQRVVDRIYPGIQSISVDHAIMEKSARVAMLPADFEWNDIGSWDAVAALWPQDDASNSSRDPLVTVDARRNVVASRGKPVALLGVEGLAVVDSGDALLVCSRDRVQDVRAIVAALSKKGLENLK